MLAIFRLYSRRKSSSTTRCERSAIRLVSERRFIEPVCVMSENGANSPTTTPWGNSEIR